MKFLLIGRTGSRICDWDGYALLRDNAPAVREGEPASARESVLGAIDPAAEEGAIVIDAARLREEVLRVWHVVLDIPLHQATASPASALSVAESPAAGAYRAPDGPLDPLAAARRVAAAKQFVTAVLELTEKLEDGETLELRVRDVAQQFAAKANRHGHSPESAGHGLARLELRSRAEK